MRLVFLGRERNGRYAKPTNGGMWPCEAESQPVMAHVALMVPCQRQVIEIPDAHVQRNDAKLGQRQMLEVQQGLSLFELCESPKALEGHHIMGT